MEFPSPYKFGGKNAFKCKLVFVRQLIECVALTYLSWYFICFMWQPLAALDGSTLSNLVLTQISHDHVWLAPFTTSGYFDEHVTPFVQWIIFHNFILPSVSCLQVHEYPPPYSSLTTILVYWCCYGYIGHYLPTASCVRTCRCLN